MGYSYGWGINSICYNRSKSYFYLRIIVKLYIKGKFLKDQIKKLNRDGS